MLPQVTGVARKAIFGVFEVQNLKIFSGIPKYSRSWMLTLQNRFKTNFHTLKTHIFLVHKKNQLRSYFRCIWAPGRWQVFLSEFRFHQRNCGLIKSVEFSFFGAPWLGSLRQVAPPPPPKPTAGSVSALTNDNGKHKTRPLENYNCHLFIVFTYLSEQAENLHFLLLLCHLPITLPPFEGAFSELTDVISH